MKPRAGARGDSLSKIIGLRQRLSDHTDPGSRADLFDIEGWIADGAKDFGLERLLATSLREEPPQVIGELIARDSLAGQQAFKALEHQQGLPRANEQQYMAETAATVLGPLADRLCRQVAEKGGTEAGTHEIEFLEEFLGRLNDQPSVLAAAIEGGFDRQQVADATLDALIQDESSISGGSPNHLLTIRIANVVTYLYEPIGESRPTPPAKLATYAQRLFQEKVLKWDAREEIVRLCASSFANLSQKLSVPLPSRKTEGRVNSHNNIWT